MLRDEDILALWSGGSVGVTRPVLGSQKVLSFARALLARVSGANDEARLLGDLLAVIHRDGGHYTDRVGVEASAEEAKRIFFSLRDREPTEAQIEAAAKEICQCHAEGCGVDPDDEWKVYCEQFRTEATRVLRAALAAKDTQEQPK